MSRLTESLLDRLSVALVTSINGGVINDPAPALDTDHSRSQHRGSIPWRRGDLLTMMRTMMGVMMSMVMNLVPKESAKIDRSSSRPFVSLDTAPKQTLWTQTLSFPDLTCVYWGLVCRLTRVTMGTRHSHEDTPPGYRGTPGGRLHSR